MGMNYGSTDTRIDRAKSGRNRSLLIVKQWVENRPYLCKTFLAALYELLPEIRSTPVDEFEHHEDHD